MKITNYEGNNNHSHKAFENRIAILESSKNGIPSLEDLSISEICEALGAPIHERSRALYTIKGRAYSTGLDAGYESFLKNSSLPENCELQSYSLFCKSSSYQATLLLINMRTKKRGGVNTKDGILCLLSSNDGARLDDITNKIESMYRTYNIEKDDITSNTQ